MTEFEEFTGRISLGTRDDVVLELEFAALVFAEDAEVAPLMRIAMMGSMTTSPHEVENDHVTKLGAFTEAYTTDKYVLDVVAGHAVAFIVYEIDYNHPVPTIRKPHEGEMMHLHNQIFQIK